LPDCDRDGWKKSHFWVMHSPASAGCRLTLSCVG
jgi:hypothetical protein